MDAMTPRQTIADILAIAVLVTLATAALVVAIVQHERDTCIELVRDWCSEDELSFADCARAVEELCE